MRARPLAHHGRCVCGRAFNVYSGLGADAFVKGDVYSKWQPCRSIWGGNVIGQQRTPAEQAREQQLLGPHHAVDGLVRGVADGAHRESLRAPS